MNLFEYKVSLNIYKDKLIRSDIMRKRTNEEYVSLLKTNNPNLEPLEPYQTNAIKILHLCKKHNQQFYIAPSSALKGCGCRICVGEGISSRCSKTHEEYVSELASKNPNIKVIETYKGAHTKIKHYCLIHNYEWNATPDNILHKIGCPKCKIEKRSQTRTKTHQQYCDELKKNGIDIIPLESYKGATTNILHKCLIHDYSWTTTPSSILQGHRCPKCKAEKINSCVLLSHDEFCNRLKNNNPNVIPLETYKGHKIPIKHKCIIHNVEWTTTPACTMYGAGCYLCVKEKTIERLTLSHEEYLLKLNECNPTIICLERYIGMKTPILHKCTVCGLEWKPWPCSLMSEHGCPRCVSSKGEKTIAEWLDLNNIKYESEKIFDDCSDINPLPFDFYLTNYNKCIEYDGEQHFRPIDFFGGESAFRIRQMHDIIKTEYCEYNNIPLLRIPYMVEDIEKELNNFIFN